MGKPYFRVTYLTEPNPSVIESHWWGTDSDLYAYAMGNCFRTYIGAETYREEIIKKIKGAYTND